MYDFRKIKDFHKTRATGVGASDIPILACMKLQFGSTPYTLWEQKTGRAEPFKGNRFTYWGHELEGLVLKNFVSGIRGREIAFRFYTEYLRNRSYKEFKVTTEFRHPEYSFALSHPDLLIVGGELPIKCPKCGSFDLYSSGVKIECSNSCGKTIEAPEAYIQEAKSHSFFAAKRDDDNPDFGYDKDDHSQDGIPVDEFLQVQWQLFTSGITTGGLSTLINTNDYREYGPVTADPRAQEKCLALAERFWWHVKHDKPPKPETWADVQKMFPQPKDTTAMIAGNEELLARRMIEQWHKLGAGEKRIKKKKSDIKNALGLLIGENNQLMTAEGIKLASSWSQKNPLSIDWENFEKKFPDVYREAWDEGIIRQTERRELRPAKIKKSA